MSRSGEGRTVLRGLVYGALAGLLVGGPVAFGPVIDGSGEVSARGFGGGGGGRGGASRGGGGGGGGAARAQRAPSSIDRQPRAASADRGGSFSRAGADRPASSQFSGGGMQRSAARPASPEASRQGLDSPQRSLSTRAQSDRAATAERQAKERVAGKRPDMAAGAAGSQQARLDQVRAKDRAGGERQQDTTQRREDRQQQITENRQQWQDNRDERREERQKALEDLQENRQDFIEDLADERRELWEDIYDDHHYWGDWDDDDDDNEWLWGIVGGVAGYMIGAAVNSPPAGTVAVPVAGSTVPYQYYGGAFYQPAPSGGQGYVTAPAPVGAVVDAPPLKCTIVYGPKEEGYCYFEGAFFLYNAKTDKYVVADPPVGTEVPYLPDGYKTETIGGVEYMKLGPTYYRPYFKGDEVSYVVSKP